MFRISKRGGESDLGLCTPSHLRYMHFLNGYYSTVPGLLGKIEVDLALCTISVHANRKPPCIGIFVSQILWPNTFFNRKSPPAAAFFFASTEVVHRPPSDSPLHFDIRNMCGVATYSRLLKIIGPFCKRAL